jgi:hypothetical protein
VLADLEHGPRVAAPPDADSGALGDLVFGLGRERGDDEWRIWVGGCPIAWCS